jgi:hypothetical protein
VVGIACRDVIVEFIQKRTVSDKDDSLAVALAQNPYSARSRVDVVELKRSELSNAHPGRDEQSQHQRVFVAERSATVN